MLRDLKARGRPGRMVRPVRGGHEWPPLRGSLRQAWIAEHAEFDGGGVCTWRSVGINGSQKDGVSPSAPRSPVPTTVNGVPALTFSSAALTTCDCGPLGDYPVIPAGAWEDDDYVFIIVGSSNTSLGFMFTQYVAGGAEFAGRTLAGASGGAALQFSPANIIKNNIVARGQFQVAAWRVEGLNVFVTNGQYQGGDTEVDRGACGHVSNVGNVIGGRSSSAAYGPASTQWADGDIGGIFVYDKLSIEQTRSVVRQLSIHWGLGWDPE